MGILGTTARVVAGVATAGLSEAVIRVSSRLRKVKPDGTEEEDAPMADPIPMLTPTPIPATIPAVQGVTISAAAAVAPTLAATPPTGVAAAVNALKARAEKAEGDLVACQAKCKATEDALAKTLADVAGQKQLTDAQANRAAQAEASFRDAEAKRVAAEARAAAAEAELNSVKTTLGV